MTDSSDEDLSDGPVLRPRHPVVQPSAVDSIAPEPYASFDAAIREKILYLDVNIDCSHLLRPYGTSFVSPPGKYVISISSVMTKITMITIDLTCAAPLWATIQTERWEVVGVSTTISDTTCISREECVGHVNTSLVVNEPALTPARKITRNRIMEPFFRRTRAKMLMDLDEVCDRLSICLR